MAEWLAWLASNCERIGAISSSPSNGMKPNRFNPLFGLMCVNVYACIVKPDIQIIHRCSHTSIHTYKTTTKRTKPDLILIYVFKGTLNTVSLTVKSTSELFHENPQLFAHGYILRTDHASAGRVTTRLLCAIVYFARILHCH